MLFIVLGIVILLGIIFVVMYNGFIRLRNNCDEAFATMDVYLKKRYDLIPNLVETVKGYATHESPATPEAKLAGENVLQGTLKSLFALAESYPDLKANQNFLELSDQLRAVEEDIANSRKYYNAVVKQFNTKCEVFPSNLIASIFHFEKKPMFEVGAAEERENVKVSFN